MDAAAISMLHDCPTVVLMQGVGPGTLDDMSAEEACAQHNVSAMAG